MIIILTGKEELVIEKKKIPNHLLKYFKTKEIKTFEVDGYIQHLCDIFDLLKPKLRKSGTLWVNLGDTYGGSGGAGGDYNEGGLREGQPKFKQAKQSKNYAKCLLMIPQRFAIEMVNRGWILRNVIIWWKPNCLSQITKLYAKTQKGVTVQTLKDLVRLQPSTVQLWDGKKWNQVIDWIINNDPSDTLDITLRNGELIRCTTDHQFPTKRGLLKASKLREGDILRDGVLPDEDISYSLIPDYMGWFIGMYLAEGSRSQTSKHNKCIQISGHKKEQERYEKLKKIVQKYDSNIYKYEKPSTNCLEIHIHSKILNAIIDMYIGGKTAKTKHLTSKVWQRNNKFLKNILDGYLDGDGHLTKEKGWCLGFTRNDLLASDLRTICARLGYDIKLRKTISKIKEKEYKSYHGSIRFDRIRTRNRKSPYEIMEIKKGRKGIYYDIILESEPHLFSTASGVLVHNCMPSSARDRFTVDHEYVYFFVKSKKYWFDQDAVRETHSGNSGWAKQREKGIDNITPYQTEGNGKWGKPNIEKDIKGRNKRTVWRIPTKPNPLAHFATFPPTLVEPMIKAGSPREVCVVCGKPRDRIVEKGEVVSTGGSDNGMRANNKGNFIQSGHDCRAMKQHEHITKGWSDCGCGASFNPGVVLDIFSGVGTTARKAWKLGRNYIGFELNPEYCKLSKEYLKTTNNKRLTDYV